MNNVNNGEQESPYHKDRGLTLDYCLKLDAAKRLCSAYYRFHCPLCQHISKNITKKYCQYSLQKDGIIGYYSKKITLEGITLGPTMG